MRGFSPSRSSAAREHARGGAAAGMATTKIAHAGGHRGWDGLDPASQIVVASELCPARARSSAVARVSSRLDSAFVRDLVRRVSSPMNGSYPGRSSISPYAARARPRGFLQPAEWRPRKRDECRWGELLDQRRDPDRVALVRYFTGAQR